ncbi:MAG: biotin/lipoyl-binding protein [Chloroflexi bacterium]|nr:biotin/lipoyl-binding protein [Chloroflexota bacterium]
MSRLAVTIDGQTFEIEISQMPGNADPFAVTVDGEEVMVQVPRGAETTPMHWLIVGDRPYEIVMGDDLNWIKAWSGRHSLKIRDLEAAVRRQPSGDGRVKAPIPGLITRVLVQAKQEVAAGQPLLILEAMKMENEIRAPRAGFVTALRVEPGQTVGMGDVLVEIS